MTLPIAPPALLSNHVEVMIKESRDQVKTLREDAKMEARATDVVAVKLFGDNDK